MFRRDQAGFALFLFSLILGTESLAQTVAEIPGIEVVTIANRWGTSFKQMDSVEVEKSIKAVVVGFDPDLCYYRLAYATCLLREVSEDSCLFIVTNEDLNFPSQKHQLPGNGKWKFVGGKIQTWSTFSWTRVPIESGLPRSIFITGRLIH